MANSFMPPGRAKKRQRTTSLRHEEHCPEAKRGKLLQDIRPAPRPRWRLL